MQSHTLARVLRLCHTLASRVHKLWLFSPQAFGQVMQTYGQAMLEAAEGAEWLA